MLTLSKPIAEDVKVPPMDVHNQTLVSNVHPPDWVNPQPAPRYNLVVIGAGTAGLITAAGAVGLGAKVALIERHLIGGDCLNVGCVPSKCLIRSARAFADVRDAGQFGVRVPDGSEVDFPEVMERMRRLRAQISHHDSAQRFKNLGVEIFLGDARFSGPDTIEVAGKKLRFNKAVITTGARAAAPQIPGIQEAGYLNNETVFRLTELPQRILVIGAGPIGCEMAQVFRRFGSEVSLFEKMPQILTREDRDAAVIVEKAFRKDGIKFICCSKISHVEKRGEEKVVHFTGHEGGHEQGHEIQTQVTVDEILVGVGREPNLEGLNLESVGVKYNRHGLDVNDYLQTTNPRIYAAGDICLKYKFTHMADASARIVIQNSLFFKSKKVSALTIPWCTYTDPEIAHVGMYEKDARESGIEIDTFVRPMREVDRAIAESEEDGFVKVHVKKGTDKILGATIVARHAGEMISEISLAMIANAGLGTIANVIHPYPTQAEAIKQTADAYNRTRLTPSVKKLMAFWLSLTR